MVAIQPGVLACAFALLVSPAAIGHATDSVFTRSWQWTSDEGQSLTFAQMSGRPIVVAPFLTSCRVRCPQTINKMKRIEAAYRVAGLPATFVLVTLDPATDRPARLATFRRRQGLAGPSWHLLTGNPKQTRAFTDFISVTVSSDDDHIDHDVHVVVFDGHGVVARNFRGWDFPDRDAVVLETAGIVGGSR